MQSPSCETHVQYNATTMTTVCQPYFLLLLVHQENVTTVVEVAALEMRYFLFGAWRATTGDKM